MENGNFGRPGPRLDPPGKQQGGSPKAQGVSKPGEFNTLRHRWYTYDVTYGVWPNVWLPIVAGEMTEMKTRAFWA